MLHIFKAIVECGSSSAAESVLGFSRSAISLHMDDLEKRLGICLCQCGRADFVLIGEGCEVYRATQALLAVLEGLCAEVSDLHQHPRGELNIGITNNLMTLPQMRTTHTPGTLKGQEPRMWINIGTTTPNEIELGVPDGRLHIGVVSLVSPLSGFEYLPLYSEYAQLCCSHGHTLFERVDGDIAVDEVLVANTVASNYRLPAEAQTRHQELNNSVNASDREGMASLTLTGNFIGYLPSHCTADWVAVGMLRPLPSERFHYAIALIVVTHKGRRPSLVLERFLEAATVS